MTINHFTVKNFLNVWINYRTISFELPPILVNILLV